MKILAIESSAVTASVAILSEDTITAEYTVHYKKTHSQTLLPMIDEIIKMTETEKNTLDVIAVSGGPGSFTGLRIGASTGKGMGLALDIPIVSVPTLEAMAYNLYGYDKIICPVMDAKRARVYTGIYRFDGQGADSFQILEQQQVLPAKELIQKLNELNQEVIFIGDGIPVIEESCHQLTAPYVFAPPHINMQRAAGAAIYAKHLYLEGKAVHAREYLPEYLCLSQAERQFMEKNEKSE